MKDIAGPYQPPGASVSGSGAATPSPSPAPLQSPEYDGHQGPALTLVLGSAERLAVSDAKLLRNLMWLTKYTGRGNLHVVLVTSVHTSVADVLSVSAGSVYRSLPWPPCPGHEVAQVVFQLAAPRVYGAYHYLEGCAGAKTGAREEEVEEEGGGGMGMATSMGGAASSSSSSSPPPPVKLDPYMSLRGPDEGGRQTLTLVSGFMDRLCTTYGPAVGWAAPELACLFRVLWPVWWYAAHRVRGMDASFGYGEGDAKLISKLTVPAFEIARARLGDRSIPPLDPSAVLTISSREGGGGAGGGGSGGGGWGGPAAAYDGKPAPRPSFLVRERRLELELPWFGKFLLLASYVGSHNPPDSDIRYLTRDGSGRTKAKRKGKGAGNGLGGGGGTDGTTGTRTVEAVLEGPRPVPLERLLAIFHALVSMFDSPAQSKAVAHNDLYAALVRLQGMRLILRTDAWMSARSGWGGANETKDPSALRYSCQMPLASVAAMAQTVGVNLGRVLHDPTAA